MMTEQDMQKWCRQNNWDEPRQLANGSWVAFPPGGVIETPLPIQFAESPINLNRVRDTLNALILTIAAVIVGVIAIIISPFFLAARLRSSTKKS